VDFSHLRRGNLAMKDINKKQCIFSYAIENSNAKRETLPREFLLAYMQMIT
jgi:hypothetical protein